MYSAKLQRNFWAKVNRGIGCWLWTGARFWAVRNGHKDPPDYGMVWVNEGGVKGARRAHRISWEIANERRVPRGLVVCHRCDNPMCVRPDHLFLGTQADNVRDMIRKGHDRFNRPTSIRDRLVEEAFS